MISYFLFIKKFLVKIRDNSESWLRRQKVLRKLESIARKIHPIVGDYFYNTVQAVIVLVFIWALFYGFLWRSPEPFPNHILITVEKGEHLSQIAENLKADGVVRSAFWLKAFILLEGGERNVIAGDYYLPKSVSVFGIANKLIMGDYGLSQIKVVIPEGLNSMEIADILATHLPRFDKQDFEDEAKDSEGFLFPDTYFFLPNTKPADIVAIMRENFARQVNDLVPDMEKFGKSLDEIVTMASIVENEARQIDTRRIIAGILWKRLRLKMPLQADAAFKYSLGRTSFELTKEDLEDKDNPYNTYANLGLPPTPISNPGLDSIRAALAPTNTDYLYFLSDKNGVMHYATNFEQHKQNRELYLR